MGRHPAVTLNSTSLAADNEIYMTEPPSGVSGVAGIITLVEREARIVGIKDFSTPTLEAVDRRRSQLWTVALCALVCLSAGVGLLTSNTAHDLGFANRIGFRIGTVVLIVGFAVYVVEKERHLRHLAKLLVDERVLGAALSNRLKELSVLYEAGKAMNSVLVLDEVLELILSSALELLEASNGYIMLLDDAGELNIVCRAGDAKTSLEVIGGIPRRVVEDREPLLVQGTISENGHVDTESAVYVPLLHREQATGVLALNGRTNHVYSEHELRAVSLFAEHAAIAVANARLYEAEKALRAQLAHQVVHDTLTGAANQVLIDDRLSHALARLKRNRGSVAVLFIDIDDFKRVNDDLGHKGGDVILSTIAQRLSGCLRSSDTVGRIGGDEFVVVCEDLVEQSGADEIARRILEELRRPFTTPFGERSVSASIGIAVSDSDRLMSAEDLIRAADGAMYRAKMGGKARAESAHQLPVGA